MAVKIFFKLHVSLCIGLIIDAFGELRSQQDQVKEDMEVSRQMQFPKHPAIFQM